MICFSVNNCYIQLIMYNDASNLIDSFSIKLFLNIK